MGYSGVTLFLWEDSNDWRGYFGLYTEIQTENNIEMEHVCLGRACHFIHLRKNFKELETRT